MNECRTIQEQFDDYHEHVLEEVEAEAFERHLERCDACRKAFDAWRGYRAAMAGLPFDPPGPGFELRVLEAARQGQRPSGRRRAFMAGFGLAMAASLVLAAVLLPMWRPPQPASEVPVISVAEGEQVRLLIQAEQPVQQARLVLELPEGIELVGYEGHRRLEWDAPLAAGNNILALPVRIRTATEQELVARVRIGDRERSFRLRLRPKLQGVALPPGGLVSI